MKDLQIKVFDLKPSAGITPEIIYQHFNWRKTNRFEGPNIVAIGNALEPIWWNRPYQSDTVVKQEADGLFSYNLPYMYRKNDIKTGYNLLVNKNSVSLIVQFKIDYDNWTAKQHHSLTNGLIMKIVYDTLIELGVDSTKLHLINNDIEYDHRKFMGTESAIHGGWFGSASIITLNYTEEAEIFKRLTGKYAGKRNICGIMEESGNIFTKEEFIERLKINFKKTFDTYK